MRLETALADVLEEVKKATANWGSFHSAHEGYAILQEEVDELWDLVKVNQRRHDRRAMRKEATQVAAMAIRFMLDLCHDD